MKEEGSEDDVPLSLCKKADPGNNNNNGPATTPCTSPSLTTANLESTSPYLASPLSVSGRTHDSVAAALGAEVVAAAHAVNHSGSDDVNNDDNAEDNLSMKSDNVNGVGVVVGSNGGGVVGAGNGSSGGRLSSSRSLLVKEATGPGATSRDKVFVCGVCNRCFGYKHVLQNHERTHTGEKPFECKECHKRFTRDHHLKTHMRLHTGEKPYHCTHCDRQFVQVANLRRHLRVHTGERPYACELCASRFSDSNQLKAHMLIHKGEKPFQCLVCLGRFRRRHHLMHHKCPKDDTNLSDKPRRGRRPKSSDDLVVVAGEHRVSQSIPTVVPMPTVVPISDRPKRERKSRETRRIIKVGMPNILGLGGEGGCSHYLPIMNTPAYSVRPPPISPPEQTEPEDLSMHSTENGDRQSNRNLNSSSLYHYRHHHSTPPPRPSSVPLSTNMVSHHHLPHHQPHPTHIRSSRSNVSSLGIPGSAESMLMSHPQMDEGINDDLGSAEGNVGLDGCSSESEAMVEEEEVEEEEEDDEDLDSDSGGGALGMTRMELSSAAADHLQLHRHHMYQQQDKSSEDNNEMRLMVKQEAEENDSNDSTNNRMTMMNEDDNEELNMSHTISKHQLLQHRFHHHHLHHSLSHHFMHPSHHVVAQNQAVVVVGRDGGTHSHSMVGGLTANRGALERQLLTTAAACISGRSVQIGVPQLSGIHHGGSGSLDLIGSGSIRRQNRGRASDRAGHGEEFS